LMNSTYLQTLPPPRPSIATRAGQADAGGANFKYVWLGLAACRPCVAGRILPRMSTKSRNRIYGSSVRISGRRTSAARRRADKLACEAWNKRMLGFRGLQPSPTLGDALNAGYCFLEVRCLGCETHQAVALDTVRRPKSTPIHELERYMHCRDCSRVLGCPLSHPPGRAAHHPILYVIARQPGISPYPPTASIPLDGNLRFGSETG
jgi:hypothetical protein